MLSTGVIGWGRSAPPRSRSKTFLTTTRKLYRYANERVMKLTMRPNSTQSGSRNHFGNEEGFLLVGVLFMVLLVTIALAIAAPKIAESIRRDKEEETIHRGKQYARAIQMYYNKFGRYPNTIDQLVKTNDQRFLRKRYLN